MAQKEYAFFHFALEDTGGAQIGGQYPLYDRGHIAEIYDANFRSRVAASGKASLIQLFDPATPGAIGASVPNTVAATRLDVDNIRIDGNAITSKDSNGNIQLTPNGTGSVVIGAVDINGGAIDATVIGGTTPAAVTGTTLTAVNNVFSGGHFRSTNGGSAASPSIQPGHDGDTGIFHPAANTIGFATLGSERMRIDPSGNLIIGSTTGGAPLHVNAGAGNLAAIFESTDAACQIELRDDSTLASDVRVLALGRDMQLYGAGVAQIILDTVGVRMSNLPTSNPGGTGYLWVDSGVLKIT